ncbi:hypothetical protein ABVK25_012268 [Lepraria finkii]|uniref:Myosin heavy chain n=1 Tax=Lepraria finkii TaxID=1340010 RepID=A0ABR4AGJ7_9LECA
MRKRIEALEQAKANTEQQLQVSEAQHPEFENLQQEYHAAVEEINSLKGSLANATKDRKDYLEAINEYRGKLEAAEEAQSSFEKNGKQVSLEQEKLLENMRRDHEEASQRQVIALQASVDKAAIERKDGVQAIRNFKNQISELSKSRDAANTLISQLQTQIQGQVASERSEGLGHAASKLSQCFWKEISALKPW